MLPTTMILLFIALVTLLFAACIGGVWTVNHPAQQRYYHVWTAADGVSLPKKFAELQSYPPDTLVCMMHQGACAPGDWYDLKDFTAEGVPRRDAMGWPPQRPAGVLSALLDGPQPPDFSE
jgi:hypothetical protein